MSGKVFLVGAGPGDPGLLTLKAHALLKAADCVVYDALVNKRLLAFARPACELIFVGKRGGECSAVQDEIEKILIERARAGRRVVRLKGGDPFIFGRGAEEALSLARAGVEWEVASGVSSAIAASAYAGIPLTHRELASTVTFLTGREDPQKGVSGIEWSRLSPKGTLVFLMGFSNLPAIVERLIGHGFPSGLPCACVMWGTLPKQKTVTGVLSDIVQKAKDASLAAPSILVVGEVVRLREELNWFEKGPLFGRRVLVTRSREQASVLVESLEGLGAEAISFPTIQISSPEDWGPVDDAIRNLERFHWLVFTSVNAVGIFLDRVLKNAKDIRDLKGLKVAAIGEMTRRSLEEKMLKVDLCPPEFVSEALLDEFKKMPTLTGAHFLLPRAQGARPLLAQGLRGLGSQVTEVALYRAEPVSVEESVGIEEILNREWDWVTFTSSSTVKNFVSGLGLQFQKLKKSFKVASIGPVTSQAAREAGLAVDLEARVHSIPGLVEALVSYHAS